MKFINWERKGNFKTNQNQKHIKTLYTYWTSNKPPRTCTGFY